MSTPGSDSFQHGQDQRKRVGKACDRCRLKKSKCDGVSPCLRCTQDNAICEFGERKKISDRAFPKGYVEMIEEQQESITRGIRMMYTTLLKHGLWEGEPLTERNGQPLTHDILERLGVLRTTGDKSALKFVDDLEGERQSMELHQRQNSTFSASSEITAIGEESDSSIPNSPRLSVSSKGSRKRSPLTPPTDHDTPAPRPSKKRPASINTKPRHFPRPSSPRPQDSPMCEASPLNYDPYAFQTQTPLPVMSPAFFLQGSMDLQSFSPSTAMQMPTFNEHLFSLSQNTTLAADTFQDAQQGLMHTVGLNDFSLMDASYNSWA